MFHQVCRAIEPALPLLQVVKHWATIAASLSEAPRRRTGQLSRMKEAGHIS